MRNGFSAKLTPGNPASTLRIVALRLLRLRSGETALQVDLELAVVRAPGVVGLLGAADALGDDAHERQLEQRVGHERADALRFRDRGAGHGRHVQGEVSLFELRQKARAEERQRRANPTTVNRNAAAIVVRGRATIPRSMRS